MSVYQHARAKSLAAARQYESEAAERLKAYPVGAGGGAAGLASSDWEAQSRQQRAYGQLRNWVYCCINVISKRLAGQPVGAGELVGASENPERRHRNRVKAPDAIQQRRVKASQELEALGDHPVLDLLAQPNPVQGKFEFLYSTVANLLLTGESYWVGGRVGAGEKASYELWAMPTHLIQPVHGKRLFESYQLVTPLGEPIPLKAENVARTYLPDPANVKLALAPLSAVMQGIVLDEAIQSSQVDMFRRGINPNVLITVGRNIGPDGKLTDRRPVLQPHQRRQILRSVREVWNQTVNTGDPAILDGLIESVHKLQMTPAEMDWINSGEVAKRRIMQAFGVNPIVLGEIVGSNRAQATEAEKQFCSLAVNPLVSAISETLTRFLGPIYTAPKRLLVWVEPCEPRDSDLELRRWTAARQKGDVSRDEFRAEQLGLPPGEDEIERNQLLSTVGGIQGTVAVLGQMAAGGLSREQAKATLMLFLEIDEATASAIVGEGATPTDLGEPDPPPQPPQPPQPQGDEGDEDEESPAMDAPDAVGGQPDGEKQPQRYSHIDMDVSQGMRTEAQRGLAWREEYGRGGTQVGVTRANQILQDGELTPDTWRRVKAYFDRHQSDSDAEGWSPGEEGYPSAGRIAWALWGGDPGWRRAAKVVEQMDRADRGKAAAAPGGLKRKDIEVAHVKTLTRKEDQVASSLARYFRGDVRATADGIAESTLVPDPERAEQQAEQLVRQYFPLEESREQVRAVMLPELTLVFVEGALQEVELHKHTVGGRKTTAEDIAYRLNIEIPEEIGIGEMPEWLVNRAMSAMDETFAQDYWQRIPETTRDDIKGTLERGIREGYSIKRLVREITDRHGRQYSRARAENVARTETLSALNAGHVAGMEQLEEETGLRIGKEWLSVLGSTTRATHAAMNGRRTKGPKGLFSLGGVKVPYPGHHDLPAKERCNCQCSVLSAAVMDNLDEAEPEPAPEPEPDAQAQGPATQGSDVPGFGQLKRKVETLGGSTGAELWEDENGVKWVVKAGSSEEHLREEYVAEELYRALGAKVPDSLLDTSVSPPRKISRYIEGGTLLKDLRGKARERAMARVAEHFAADALLGNWDVAGLDLDNVIVDEAGDVWRIDTGGALRYRAQGSPKGSRFTRTVGEIWTLRDSEMNPASQQVFRSLTMRRIAEQALELDGDQLQATLRSLKERGVLSSQDEQLVERLQQRQQHLRRMGKAVVALDDDGFVPTYVEDFAKAQRELEEAGVYDGLAKQLAPSPGAEAVHLNDENNVPWDKIRSKGSDPDSVSQRFYDHVTRTYGSNKDIIRYHEGQGGDSWSSDAALTKTWFVAQQDIDAAEEFWWKRDHHRPPEGKNGAQQKLKEIYVRKQWDADRQKEFHEQMTAQHAFTYHLLTEVKLPNTDAEGNILLGRTEANTVLTAAKLKKGDTGKLKRGALESYSVMQYVSVYGSERTIQRVPPHRVFVTYIQGDGWSSRGTCMYGDNENEFVAMCTPDQEVAYLKGTKKLIREHVPVKPPTPRARK